jgi:hypothetical protein
MRQGQVTAVLGPTNTGKTHYAIERMLAHRTGVIGLPLRLLAREVYDRIVSLRGPSVVALVTGEERIVPDRVQYWVCTVEAMPLEIGADFVAIDEIQLCADPDRGHVFTERLLHARGLHETLFSGLRYNARGHLGAGAQSAVRSPRAVFNAGVGRIEENRADAGTRGHRRVFGRKRLCHCRIDPPHQGWLCAGDGRA